MKPAIVLVHGAWGGAWIWRRVLPLLRAGGHEVHAVTLTGVGERAHLPGPCPLYTSDSAYELTRV